MQLSCLTLLTLYFYTKQLRTHTFPCVELSFLSHRAFSKPSLDGMEHGQALSSELHDVDLNYHQESLFQATSRHLAAIPALVFRRSQPLPKIARSESRKVPSTSTFSASLNVNPVPTSNQNFGLSSDSDKRVPMVWFGFETWSVNDIVTSLLLLCLLFLQMR